MTLVCAAIFSASHSPLGPPTLRAYVGSSAIAGAISADATGGDAIANGSSLP